MPIENFHYYLPMVMSTYLKPRLVLEEQSI